MSNFFLTGATQGTQLAFSYNLGTVTVSILVAIISSILALQVAGVARQSDRLPLRHIALASGSIALGGGIWSMHFIGMLALQTGIHIHYDPLITLVSIAPSVFASWVALQMLANDKIDTQQLLGGGILVGAGIGTMHYCGMMAMHTDAQVVYEPWTFALSILAAVLLATFALWIKFKLANYFTRLSRTQITLLAGTILGMAITSMHYLGMEAARIVVSDPAQLALAALNPYQASHEDMHNLVMQIGLTTLALSVVVFAVNLLLRYRELYSQLSHNEAQLRAIVETAVDGIISIDGRGRIIAMNTAAETLFGWRQAEIQGENINILMPEPFHSEHDSYLRNFFTTGEARIIGTGRDVVAKRKDGRHVPIRLAVGKADLPGQHLFVGFVSDISARINMEREIIARETQYRTLISNMPGVAFRIEAAPPWRTLFVSDAITKLSGWAPEYFINQQLSLASITHPDDYARIYDTITQALREQRPYTLEFRMIDRFGTEHWVSQSASAVNDPNSQTTWLDGVIIDITDTKKRAAEFEGIVRSIGRSALFVEFDLSGRVLNANDNFVRLMDYSRSQLQRMHHRDLLCMDAHDHAHNSEFWQTLTKGNFHMGEYCLKAANRRQIWVQASFNPIFDSDGKPWKVVALGNDLSQRKAMETDLFIAKNKAEQAATAKDLFLANMSHEIRTPMNAIMGFTDLLLDSARDSTQQKHLRTISQAARSLLRLLNDILDTAKLERGAVDLDIQVFSLRELTAQILQEQQLNAAKKSLALSLDYPDNLRDFVSGDALRVKQILMNLLGNAVKFTETGAVILRVRERGATVIFKVVDTGIGIASDRLAHIFTPFTQADASMARRFGGTGLGTTIARQLAELMQGSVSAASIEGKGSTFTAELPLPAAAPQAPAPASASLQLAPLHVLIADDVPENVELLELLLRRDGHRVTTARDGQDAFTRFTQDRFDAVLMDIQMPLMDGLDSTRNIRAWELAQARTATPIIALTASVLERDRAKAAQAGMDGFASKPIDLQALYRELAQCLNLSDTPLQATAPQPADAADNHAAAALDWARAQAPDERRSTEAPIDWLSAEARWGERAPLLKALGNFISQARSSFADLAALEAPAAAAILHKYKGAASNLSLYPLAAQLAEIESQPDYHHHSQTLMPLLDAVEQQWRHACTHTLDTAVGAAGETIAPLRPAIASPTEARALLAQLQREFIAGAINDTLLAQLAQYCDDAALAELLQAVEDFDLDRAAQLAGALSERCPDSEPAHESIPPVDR